MGKKAGAAGARAQGRAQPAPVPVPGPIPSSSPPLSPSSVIRVPASDSDSGSSLRHDQQSPEPSSSERGDSDGEKPHVAALVPGSAAGVASQKLQPDPSSEEGSGDYLRKSEDEAGSQPSDAALVPGSGVRASSQKLQPDPSQAEDGDGDNLGEIEDESGSQPSTPALEPGTSSPPKKRKPMQPKRHRSKGSANFPKWTDGPVIPRKAGINENGDEPECSVQPPPDAPSPPQPRSFKIVLNQPQTQVGADGDVWSVVPVVPTPASTKKPRLTQARQAGYAPVLPPVRPVPHPVLPAHLMPTKDELDDAFLKLKLRGSLSLEDVKREWLDDVVHFSALHYDAIVPWKNRSHSQVGYDTAVQFDVNMFPVTVNTKQYFKYSIDWNPVIVGNNHGCRTWRLETWRKAMQQAQIMWKREAATTPSLLEGGIGAWNSGYEFIRADEIPEAIIKNSALNPLAWKGVHQSPQCLWDTTQRQIRLRILSHTTKRSCEIVETDMSSLLKGGGNFRRWERLRDALSNVLFMYPCQEGWLEDRRLHRLFFPSGDAATLKPQLGESVTNEMICYSGTVTTNDMFVFRRGIRTAPKLFPGGVYINVWSSFAPYFKAGITVAHAIEVVLALKSSTWDGGSLSQQQLNWVAAALEHVRVKTKLTNQIHAYLNPNTHPTRYYEICGFSQFPCGKLRVPLYDQAGRSNDFLPFCENLYSAAFKKWPTLEFKKVAAKLKNLPAVKVHCTKEFYFPPWALEIKEHSRHGSKRGHILGNTACQVKRELHITRGANEHFDLFSMYLQKRCNLDVFLPAFKLLVDPTPLRVTGCILRAPSGLQLYDGGSRRLVGTRMTRYNWERQKLGMAQYGHLKDYIVFHTHTTNRSDVVEWLQTFRERSYLGPNDLAALKVVTKHFHNCHQPFEDSNDFLDQVEAGISKYRTEMNTDALPSLALLFTDGKDYQSGIYEMFKCVCDIFYGIPSQVINLRTWAYLQNPVALEDAMTNLLVKLNKKLGGTNAIIKERFIDEYQMPGTMIFGADVTHPAFRVRHSIASIVATNDMPPRTYGARVRMQHARQELIQDTEHMVQELVEAFRRSNPDVELKRVFFFRDGVSDVMFQDILIKEIPAFFRGVEAAIPGCKPKLVYLLCIKRHHTRFRQSVYKGEMGPGTVVNDLPVFPLQTSFFLCSHLHPLPWKRGKHSCTRSTMYHVLVDQLGMSLPDLQTMIYHLCFLYERGRYNPAIVPAAHYAHLACTRGRAHYITRLQLEPGNTLPVEQPWGTPQPFGTIYKMDANDAIRDTMYYL